MRYLAFGLLLLGGCASTSERGVGLVTAEDSVYAALIEHYLEVSRESSPAILIPDSTTALRWAPSDPFGIRLFGRFTAALPPELVASFEAAIPERAAMNPELVGRFAPRVRSFRFLPGPGGGIVGYYREPDGREMPIHLDGHGTYVLADGTGAVTHTFSRVGFDREGRRALLYDSGQCGPRCGGSALILMERDGGGRWQYARTGEGGIY